MPTVYPNSDGIVIPGYVYFIQCVTGQYKVGKAQSVKPRLSSLQIATPHKLTLIHKIECEDYSKAETLFHSLLKEQRVLREWFEISDTQISNIKQLTYLSSDDLQSDWLKSHLDTVHESSHFVLLQSYDRLQKQAEAQESLLEFANAKKNQVESKLRQMEATCKSWESKYSEFLTQRQESQRKQEVLESTLRQVVESSRRESADNLRMSDLLETRAGQMLHLQQQVEAAGIRAEGLEQQLDVCRMSEALAREKPETKEPQKKSRVFGFIR